MIFSKLSLISDTAKFYFSLTINIGIFILECFFISLVHSHYELLFNATVDI